MDIEHFAQRNDHCDLNGNQGNVIRHRKLGKASADAGGSG